MSRPMGRPVDTTLEARFLQATVELISTHGYRAVSMAAIAKHVGASTASLYRRWPSKRDLVLAAARTFSPVNNDDGSDLGDTGSLVGDLTAEIECLQELMAQVGPVILGLLAEAQHDPELLGVLDEVLLQPTRDVLAEILDRAVTRGELAGADQPQADALADMVLGGCLLHRATSLSPRAPRPARQWALGLAGTLTVTSGAATQGAPSTATSTVD
ncbi:TetR/AcrR family transcriptional regulator [Kocuria soli]|uniref:TetR/AcrR family transcriptional regulator n=1 Tax=Kocuria soli TaxID=2485125 RepID=A0A3N4A244_9MICC|nr:TetR/AcrR family transcriptional regulator [Kocuria soli]ROZ62359.1 TetR/AcrR family transcriptional regulator [Kocuria soli]